MKRNSMIRTWLAMAAIFAAITALMPDTALAKPIPKPPVLTQTVTVRESPPRITLQWENLSDSGGYEIYRKSPSGSSWGPRYATVKESASPRFDDDNVVVGVGYDYRVSTVNKIEKNGTWDVSPPGISFGYVYSGIALPAVDSRGKVILLVDNTMTAPLAGELARLELDLVGDGWTVLRHDVARQAVIGQNATSAEVSAIQTIIQNDYNADSNNVKQVFIVGGGVPCPIWNVRPNLRSNDGAYSMGNKLGVGRICMIGMSGYMGLTETELMRRYLNKDHAFRHRHTAFQTRACTTGADSAQDLMSIPTLVGRDMMDGNYTPIDYTMLFSGGAGYFFEMAYPPSRYAANNFQVVFGAICSEHNDGIQSAAAVASGGAYLIHYELGAGGGGSYNGSYNHWLAMGETIGFCQQMYASKSSLYDGGFGLNLSLNGDPTIRMLILAPPGGLTVSGDTLSWDASYDAGTDGFRGYHVYRATTLAGPFTRLTATPVADTSWTDPAPLGGASVYQVRAIKLETSNTGTYYNNSQGIFATRGAVGIVPSAQWVKVPEGRTASLRVKLSSQPASNVTVTVARTSGDPSISVQSGASLTFTPVDWNAWQGVTLAAGWDADTVDGNAAFRLSASGLTDVTVGTVMADAAVELDSVDGGTVLEGGYATYRVRLSSPPAWGEVTVTSTITQPSGKVSVVSGGKLTFTSENWHEWQTVTIAYHDDQGAMIGYVLPEFSISAPGYRTARTDFYFPCKHINLFRVSASPGVATVEPYGYSTAAKGEPIPISCTPAPGYRFNGWSTDWSTLDGVIADPSSPNTTCILIDDASYSADVAANVSEGSPVALISTLRDPMIVPVQEGGTGTFRVRLTARPGANTTVGVGQGGGIGPRPWGDADITVQSGASLTFTTNNWDQWQTVTLAAAEDEDSIRGKTIFAISGAGLVTATILAYEVEEKQLLTIRPGIGGLTPTPKVTTPVMVGAPTVITAIANIGYRFDQWIAVSGSVTFEDAYAANTTVTPDGGANILALFVPAEDRPAPRCTITSPAGSLAMQAGTTLSLGATASVFGGKISKVAFYRDGIKIGEDASAPYTCEWSNVPRGIYNVTARATDSEGMVGDPSVAVLVVATADGTWSGVLASGGDEVYDYMAEGIVYRAHTFRTLGAAKFVVSGVGADNQVEYLVVAGGGGGGSPMSRESGGGGAGGVLAGTTSVSVGPYAVAIGGGGIGGAKTYNPAVPNSSGYAGSGQNSVFGAITAIGGGNGASWGPQQGPGSGGSGGGGMVELGGGSGGLGTPGQGYAGGAYGSAGPGGGGGAGGAGGIGVSTAGGPGVTSGITGSDVTYAAGGIGRKMGTKASGADGAPNTGNGGEGGSDTVYWSTTTGGDGGSGIVVVRYRVPLAAPIYPVTYDANGATSGTVPGWQTKTYNVTLTLAANNGNLGRTGYTFAGWNTAADGTGADYAPGASYTANAAAVLYAKWTAASYTVTYNANGATVGTAPAPQTKVHGTPLSLAVNSGGLARSGYVSVGWNTEANGTGKDYALSALYTANAAVTLYARWMPFGNQPPTIVTPAWATPNPTLSGATRVGVVGDAGGGALAYEWHQASGPGTAAFDAPGASESQVNFSAAGTYVLRVTVANTRGETVYSDVTVTVVGVMAEVSELSVPEGGTAALRVKLSAPPAANVTVTAARASGDSDITVHAGASLTFTPSNWDSWQTITLAAAEDADTDNGTAVIVLSGVGITVGATVIAVEDDNDTTVLINVGAGGTVSPVGYRIVTKGVATPITAIPNTGYSFGQWIVTQGSASIAAAEAANTTVTLTEPATIRANFTEDANTGATETWTWGFGWGGQLGDGTTDDSLRPKEISFTGADTIACGSDHTVARKPDGSVWSWGRNFYGSLGDGTTVDKLSPVQVDISGVTAVAASYHTLALKTDGTVWAWGRNWYGAIGDGTTVKKVSPVQVSGLSGVCAVAAGTDHTVAVKSDGSVWTWGYNAAGQLGNGTTANKSTPGPVTNLSGVCAVAAGGSHTVALTSNGTVWAWGSNGSGQLGDGTTTNRLLPVEVKMADGSPLSDVTAVAAREAHTFALKTDGSLWAWGFNSSGQLGDGTTTKRLCPVQVTMADGSAFSGVSAVAAGNGHTLAMKEDGTVWAWGYNYYGQLGDGTTENKSTPMQVTKADGTPLVGVSAIGAGFRHSAALIPKQRYVRVLTAMHATVQGAANLSLTVREGGTVMFWVKLSAPPLGNVTVTATRTSGDADITGTSLTFTPSNWFTYQAMTLTAAEDTFAQDGLAMLTLTGAGVDLSATVTVNKLDNDATLTVGAGPGGATTPAGTSLVLRSVAVPVAATPASGYVFLNWTLTGGSALIANPNVPNTTVMIGSLPTAVQANFAPVGVNRGPIVVSAAQADSNPLYLPFGTVVRVTAFDPDGDPLTYAWSKLSGPGTVVFSAPDAAASAVLFGSASRYTLRVTVSDGRGGIVTSDVDVEVKPMISPPAITGQPADITVCVGLGSPFRVDATGDNLSYQWYRNGVEIFTGTKYVYPAPGATLADNGAKFKVLVSNPGGSVMSREATLTVLNEAGGTGLTGKFYNNYDFTDLFLTKVDPGVGYGGYGGFEHPFPLSTFGARWTGQVRPQYTGTYTFQGYSCGDVRLWVNGVLMTDEWNGIDDNHGKSGTIALIAGQKYDIRLDYRAIGSQGDVNLIVSSPHVSQYEAAHLYPVTSGTNFPPTFVKQAWADSPVVELPSGTTVSMEACDQNEADTLSYAWSQVSGPGTATFTTPTGASSAVSFSAPGPYVLRVTVSDDKGGSATSDVTVTVNPAGSSSIVLHVYEMWVNEDSGGSVNVKLSSRPAAQVTVGLTFVGDGHIAIGPHDGGPRQVTIQPDNWNVWHHTRVGAGRDNEDATDGTGTVTYSAPGYSSAVLTVHEKDDETTLTVTAAPGGTTTPAGDMVVYAGTRSYDWQGPVGNVYAVPNAGYIFAGWTVTSGTATIANPGVSDTTVTLNSPATIQANFVVIGGGENMAPIANPQSVSTVQNTAKAITLTGSDPEGSALTYTVVTTAAHGTLSGAGASRTYTPAANYTGADSFTFKVNDGTQDSAPATVLITVTAADDPNLDSDGDGIPDWWMQKYFGHAIGQAWNLSRAADDSDGDGMSNWQEWRAGTDPTSGMSCLAMSGLTRHPSVAGGFVVSWRSESNKLYTLQAGTNLFTGFTLTLGSDIPATPPINVHTDNVSGVECRFYRVRVE